MTTDNGTLLHVDDLKKHFPVGSSFFLRRDKAMLKAVDGVTFDIEEGTTYGLVGESGCGKSTTAKLILQLEEPTAGTFAFEGQNVTDLNRDEQRNYKANVQAVFKIRGHLSTPG